MASCHVRAVMLRRKEYRDETDYNIALAVATHMGSDGRPATVSLATVAEYAHCHYNTADKRTKAMTADNQLVTGRSGRYLAYSVPYEGSDGEPEGDKAAEAEIIQVRQEMAELREQITQQMAQLTAVVTKLSTDLHTIVTRPSHDLHTSFTLTDEDDVTKVGKYGSSEENTPQTPQAPSRAGGGVGGESKTQALVSHFCNKTKLNPPKQRQKIAWRDEWLEPLNDILELVGDDLTAACGLIDRAVDYMRQNELTIARPQSILSIAVTLHSKSQLAPKTANGVDTAWKEVKAQAGNRGTPAFSNPVILDAVRDIWPELKKMTSYTEKELRATFEQKYQELTHVRH